MSQAAGYRAYYVNLGRALEDHRILSALLQRRVEKSVSAFAEQAWLAVRTGLWRPELAANGMEMFLRRIAKEALDDANGHGSISFEAIMTSEIWIGCLEKIADVPPGTPTQSDANRWTSSTTHTERDALQEQPHSAMVEVHPHNETSSANELLVDFDTGVGYARLLSTAPPDASQSDQNAGPPNSELRYQRIEAGERLSAVDTLSSVNQSNTKPRRKNTNPTAEQIAAAETAVRTQPDVSVLYAAWYLRCTIQHVLRLVRARKLIASNTRPMRITTASLLAYKWPNGAPIESR